ncbi:MAG: helix-turn-helix transcriptional regulator, partial [Clostridiales Family XIII bacterium]|nr:helix-turn-helix transcriptional regulator [Clostridiales Family XIII bacterium]
MQINELREEQNLTIYKLAKESGVPYATVNDICNEKVSLRKCSAETLYKLAKTLGVSMEAIIESAVDDRTGFDTFKSNVCHMVKDLGDFDFIAELLSSDKIREYW